jgi:hypothetical protein
LQIGDLMTVSRVDELLGLLMWRGDEDTSQPPQELSVSMQMARVRDEQVWKRHIY